MDCAEEGNVSASGFFIVEIVYIFLFVPLLIMVALTRRWKTSSRKVAAEKSATGTKSANEDKNTVGAIALKRLIFQNQHKKEYVLKEKKGSKSKRPYWETDASKVKFVRKLAAGSFGEVWLADWMGGVVAVKTIIPSMAKNPAFIENFKEEIQLMSQFNHPNIVMFLGASLKAPRVCLILELCIHGNLLDFLKFASAEKTISVDMHLVLKMALDIARGIRYLHEKIQVIQRDLKGRNILVDGDLNCKIADFGLSKLKRNNTLGSMTACGTPAWTAPEVIRMEDYSEKVDVYSFGIVLWELLMRTEPYGGEAGVHVAYAAAEEGLRPKIPKFVPERFSKLMAQCWADKPEDRPDFTTILEKLFSMLRDERNAKSRAEFYFGPRNFDDIKSKYSHLLENDEKESDTFDENYAETVKKRLVMNEQNRKRLTKNFTSRSSSFSPSQEIEMKPGNLKSSFSMTMD